MIDMKLVLKMAERYIRPSALKPLSLCSGRALMEAAVTLIDGEEPESEEASAGTAGHNVISNAIMLWTAGLQDWGGAIEHARAECDNHGMSGYDTWSVVWCIEFARDLIAHHDIDRDNVMVELGLAMDGFRHGGTADLVLVDPFRRVIVVDWKLGNLDQGDADEHDQTQAYAWGAARYFQCEEVIVHLAQPKAEKHRRKTGAIYDAEALLANHAWSQSVINLARGDRPELVAGYEQCVYCDALLRCPEAQGAIMDAIQAITDMQPCDSAERGRRIGLAKLAKKWADRIEKADKKALMDGETADGWTLKPGGTMRSIKETLKAYDRMIQAGKLAEFLEACSIRMGELSPADKELLADLIEEKEKAPSLAPDRRSA
ncbi:MAG: DUF2800 domain-containing protein [Halothiobacillaceae bacterium]